MTSRQPGVASWLLSLLLHAALLAVLWWSAAPAVLHTPPPLAVELWAGGGSPLKATPKVQPVPPPAAVPKPAPVPPPPAPQVQAPALKSADVTLKGGKPQPKPAPPPEKPRPEKPRVEKPRAEIKPVVPPVKAAEPRPAAPKPAAKPAKTKPAVSAADDMLDALDNLPPGPGKGKVTQAGSKQGVQGGSANGVADLRAQYIEEVRNRVRPYVMVPDGIVGNPQAVVVVEILPTMEIRPDSLHLLHSSGNGAYDQAVLAALREAHRFPPLPKGAEFTDFRRITLKFRPKE
ncbi:energy transducer TonB [Vogesella sp. LIG4]|uniref:energy transducer TonB n=1 Tax=Vogesella sp. LIG4 TaxID=1192162 RepID=UPI00081FBFD6|nr:energy transducer TonB [Vogesella sp. LIG4]SCK10599.1 colicin import membrane protein [Vogesella sp. LIG4]